MPDTAGPHHRLSEYDGYEEGSEQSRLYLRYALQITWASNLPSLSSASYNCTITSKVDW